MTAAADDPTPLKPGVSARGERAVAVGISHGPVSTGPNANINMLTLPNAGLPDIAQTPAPPGTARVRGSRGSGAFVGRKAELRALAEADGGACVLIGLGGSGKSTLARKSAQQRRENDNPVWWIEGRSRELIDAGLAELAIRLAPVFAGLPVPLASSWARSWLAANRGWLLVLDDVDSPDDVRDLIEDLPDGSFLLTSRQGAGWQGLARTVRVGNLPLEDATELLERVIRNSSVSEPDLTGAAVLCERLGLLPLAIEQAGAFIAQNASSPAKYLALLESVGAGLFDHAAVGADPQRTVARIWRVTFDRLAENPLAVQMLRTFAWFAPTDIPRGLDSGLGDQVALESALNLLAAYHLVTLSPDAISVHPLVQEIARTPSDDDPHRSEEAITQARENATVMLFVAGAGLSSYQPEHRPMLRRLFPHIEALAANSRPELDTEQTAVLFGWLGQKKFAQGDDRGAISILTRAADDCERLLAPGHKRTVQTRLMLAYAHRDAGNAALSLKMQEALVPIATASLGPTHKLTLMGRAALGSAYEAVGGHEKAIRELRALVDFCVAERGEQDPTTLVARSNLAGVLAKTGRADEAVEIYEAVYALTLAEDGPDRPSTLLDANNLAFALRAAGHLDRAIELFESVANRRQRVLGEEHPHTLSSVLSLAIAVSESGDHARGRDLTEQVLATRERVLGPDHPDTQATQDTREGLRYLVARNENAEISPASE
jgi:tetratricopeptide (TPR) repeat protein